LFNEQLLTELPERREDRMPSVTPADVLARRRQLMLNGDADGFADLFAPDAVIEFSFHGPPGTPVRLEGREVIREYSRRVIASPLRLEDYEVAELYQTQDPEVVIAEMRAKATVTTTGRSITATSIQILRIREGHIVLFRDFADPRVLEDVIGNRVREADVGPGRGVVRRVEAGAGEPAVVLEAGLNNGLPR
jgi:uncharacterized protein